MGIEFAPIYFNSATKAIINSDKCGLDKSFKEVLYRIGNWINEGCGSLIESIVEEYVNISVYSSLSRSTDIKLPRRLRISMKDLINIKKRQLMLSLVPY